MDGREKYRRRIEGRVQFVFGAIFGSGLFLNVAAKVRLRPHHHKHRRDAGQFLRILHSYLYWNIYDGFFASAMTCKT